MRRFCWQFSMSNSYKSKTRVGFAEETNHAEHVLALLLDVPTSVECVGSGVSVFTALSGVRIADELPWCEDIKTADVVDDGSVVVEVTLGTDELSCCEDIETAVVVDDGPAVVGVTVFCSPIEALSLFLPVTENIIKISTI